MVDLGGFQMVEGDIMVHMTSGLAHTVRRSVSEGRGLGYCVEENGSLTIVRAVLNIGGGAIVKVFAPGQWSALSVVS